MLLAMKHSPVRNYAIPGLTSWLIGAPSDQGCIRLFECSREHMEPIIPHSHRFDFQCWVLQGWVRNRIWRRNPVEGDWFMTSTQRQGRMGGYDMQEAGTARFTYDETTYGKDEWYSMTHREIHSIWFGRDTKVLFFEGPKKAEETTILEPMCDGVRVPTFKVEPWMFKRES
jgi:hypothetical protein